MGHNSSLDAYYEFNPQLNILSSFWYGGSRRTNEGESDYSSSLEGIYSVFQESLNNDTELEWTTDLVKKFLNNEERELRFAFQLGGHFHDDESFVGQSFGLNTGKPSSNQNQLDYLTDSTSYDNVNDGTGKEYTFQLDYIHPFSKKHKIELQ